MLVRLLISIAVTWFIVLRLYYKKGKRIDFCFTFMLISIAIFFIVFFMVFVLEDMKGKTSMGIGIGLFGIFSIMRYRTDAMPVREMTYLFIIIALAVVNAIAEGVPLLELAITNLIVLAAVWICEIYLKTLPSSERRKIFAELMKRHIPALIICHSMQVYPECLEMAEKYQVSLLTTELDTSVFEAELITTLNVHLGPRITRHGTMMEVYGEGIMIMGESGVGKSECAIELVKRGHRLIADDAVELKKISYRTLFAQAPPLIQHYIEIRGIGVVDVGAVDFIRDMAMIRIVYEGKETSANNMLKLSKSQLQEF